MYACFTCFFLLGPLQTHMTMQHQIYYQEAILTQWLTSWWRWVEAVGTEIKSKGLFVLLTTTQNELLNTCTLYVFVLLLHVFWVEPNFLLVRDEFCLSQTLGYSSNSWSCCSSWCSRRKHNWSTSYRGSRSCWNSKQRSIKSFPAGLLLSWFIYYHCVLKHVLTNCTIQQGGSNAGGGAGGGPLEFLRNNQQVLIV